MVPGCRIVVSSFPPHSQTCLSFFLWLAVRDKYHYHLFCSPFVLYLYEVRAAFQAFRQHPRWLYESAYGRLLLIDFPTDTSCPPLQKPVFLFLIPTAQSHDQSSPWRVVRIPVCTVCLASWMRVCLRKVRGKGRPIGHHGLKGKVIITVMKYGCSSVSCILLCLHAPAPWPCFRTRKAFPFPTLKPQHCQSPLFTCGMWSLWNTHGVLLNSHINGKYHKAKLMN